MGLVVLSKRFNVEMYYKQDKIICQTKFKNTIFIKLRGGVFVATNAGEMTILLNIIWLRVFYKKAKLLRHS